MQNKAEEALEQLRQYEGGSLGATELMRTRYIVLVSEEDLVAPSDLRDGEITYRHILLSVSLKPSSPSQVARNWAFLRQGSTAPREPCACPDIPVRIAIKTP
jgi:hypothetical protein